MLDFGGGRRYTRPYWCGGRRIIWEEMSNDRFIQSAKKETVVTVSTSLFPDFYIFIKLDPKFWWLQPGYL